MNAGQMTTSAILGIGTASFLPDYGLPGAAGSLQPPGDAVLAAALAGGVRYIDTAAEYGAGETAVGRVAPAGVRVCTKAVPTATLADVHRSVGRLGRPADTILLHSAGREQIASAPAVGALREARDTSLTERIGASTYGSEAAQYALLQPWLDVVQVEYSILNQSVIRAISRSRAGQEVVVRSVLCKGLLTARRTAAPGLAAQVPDALAGIDACAREWGRGVEELAIRFALDTPGIDVVLVGVSTLPEVETALAAAASSPLTHDEWARLAAFDRSDADAAHPERWGMVS